MARPASIAPPTFARLLAQVERMLRESGDHTRARDFDAAAWLAAWLRTPAPALGGRTPGECLRTPDGAALVSRLLDAQQSGAYW